MILERATTESVKAVGENIYLLTMNAPQVAKKVEPGQFVNIRPSPDYDPLLRRPFSVYRRNHDTISIIFNVVGKGTKILHDLASGDPVDLLGPLGKPFSLQGRAYETALLVGGGLGVAPLPILTDYLRKLRKRVVTFIGGRSSDQLVEHFLEDVHLSTDDGSRGFHGTVVSLLQTSLTSNEHVRPAIFGCGPNPMLKALAELAARHRIPCQISLEGPMGCGFGICQGCPVRLANGSTTYALMCKQGPVFDAETVVL